MPSNGPCAAAGCRSLTPVDSTPHPKLSYAGAVPTGVASEAEYFEIATDCVVRPGDVRDRLDAALPDGLDVIDVTEPHGRQLGR